MLGSNLNVLLIRFTRNYKIQGKELEAPAGELFLLQNFEGLIEQHFKDHQPVRFYADKLNVTIKHLSQVCKESINKTSKELILERSKLVTQRLLFNSKLTSSQITADLGYFDNAYRFRFSKSILVIQQSNSELLINLLENNCAVF